MRVARLLFLLSLSLSLSSLSFFSCLVSARADAPKIRVRGAAKISARASRDTPQAAGQADKPPNELVLSGTLSDDAGEPLVSQSITIRVTREADANDDRVAEGLRGARGCDRSAYGGATGGRGPAAWSVRVAGTAERPEVIVVTDAEGRFCFRAKLDPDRYRAQLVWTPKGGGLVDGVERELAFDLSRRALVLRFDPTPRVLSLDTPRASLDAVAIVDDDAVPKVAPALPLVLASETGELARGLTDASGRARFMVDAAKLGPPGPGELRVSFAGDAETAGASHVEEIERHVKVALKVPAADRGELKPQVPEDGIPLVVDVTSVAGPVSEGSVEARFGEVVVGAAPVERGLARLTVTFAAQGTEVLLRLRYVPASPWYEPLGEPTIHLPIRGPSLWSKAPILVAGLAVLLFFLVGRFSGKSTKPEPERPKADAEVQEAKPRVDVVRAAARGEHGWRGRVVDAHEGTPIDGARVWVERGTFEGTTVLVSVGTTSGGRFALPPLTSLVGDERLAAEGPLHARLAQPLPPPSELSIALAERRRALLARLVAWAKRKGPPFDTRPEPTPGHVRRVSREEEPEAAEWAAAIERAAFGPETVDARAERAIDALAPSADEAPALVRDDGRRPPKEEVRKEEVRRPAPGAARVRGDDDGSRR